MFQIILKTLINSIRRTYNLLLGHSFYKNNEDLMNKIFDKDKLVIFDTIGVLSHDEIALLSKKHTVKVLGRGDI